MRQKMPPACFYLTVPRVSDRGGSRAAQAAKRLLDGTVEEAAVALVAQAAAARYQR